MVPAGSLSLALAVGQAMRIATAHPGQGRKRKASRDRGVVAAEGLHRAGRSRVVSGGRTWGASLVSVARPLQRAPCPDSLSLLEGGSGILAAE